MPKRDIKRRAKIDYQPELSIVVIAVYAKYMGSTLYAISSPAKNHNANISGEQACYKSTLTKPSLFSAVYGLTFTSSTVVQYVRPTGSDTRSRNLPFLLKKAVLTLTLEVRRR